MFIAGTNKTLVLDASKTVVAKSSAYPLLTLAIKFAEAGITMIKSCILASLIWPISVSSVKSNRFSYTLFSESEETDKGVMNFLAELVIITLIKKSFSFNFLIK